MPIKRAYEINSIIFLCLDFEVIKAIKYPNKHDIIVGIILENKVKKTITIKLKIL